MSGQKATEIEALAESARIEEERREVAIVRDLRGQCRDLRVALQAARNERDHFRSQARELTQELGKQEAITRGREQLAGQLLNQEADLRKQAKLSREVEVLLAAIEARRSFVAQLGPANKEHVQAVDQIVVSRAAQQYAEAEQAVRIAVTDSVHRVRQRIGFLRSEPTGESTSVLVKGGDKGDPILRSTIEKIVGNDNMTRNYMTISEA